MRRGVLVGLSGAMVAAVTAGCAARGIEAGATPVARPSGAAFTAALPPGFSAQSIWSETVPWKMTINVSGGGALAPDLGLMVMQGEGGVARVVGSSVAVISFTPASSSSPATRTLQFRSLADGALLKSVSLTDDGYSGMGADTVSGRPVVVVYTTSDAPADEKAGGGKPVKVASVYGADGSLVWTSRGQALAASAGEPGLETYDDGYPVFGGGYAVRSDGAGESEVLDTTGRAVLKIAGQAAQVSLDGGYALVSQSAGSGSDARVSMDAYDLEHGGTGVGQWSEAAAASGQAPNLLTASGGRLLAAWPARSGTANATALAVLDTATGKASTIASLPAGLASPNNLGAVLDPATGDTYVYDQAKMTSASAMIRLSSATALWTRQSEQDALVPISVHGGAIYAVQLGSTVAAMSLATVSETDGAVTAGSFKVVPFAFTASGAAVLGQSTSPTVLSALQIGVSSIEPGRDRE